MRTFFYVVAAICALIGFVFLIVTFVAMFAAGGLVGGLITGRSGAAFGFIAAIAPAANAVTIAFDRLANP